LIRPFSLALLLTALVAGAAYADDAPPQASDAPTNEASSPVAEAASDEPSSDINTGMSLETATVTKPGNVTVDFKDADIQNVLRILAFKSGVNIVAGKDVQGLVTIRLVDVPWEKALDVILKTYGYAYDRQDNVIRVATLDNLRKEDLSTEVFTLNYSRAADIEKSIKEMLSERGRMRSDSRSNMIIVTDMPTSLQNIRTIIRRLDSATPQVLIEAKVIELTLGSSDRLGIDWNARASVSGPSMPSTFPFSATQRTYLSRYRPYGRGTQTGAVGVGAAAATTTVEDFPKGEDGSSIQPTFPVADKLDYKFGTMDLSEFRAVLEMIQGRENTKLLSEPHVTVLNNQEAKILVGEVIAIPTFERNTTTGKMEITGYEDRDLGIRLSVLPQVNSENEIVVAIHPEITTLLGYDDLTAEIKAPRFNTREALTNVRIRSGQTIAIGGLIKEDVTNRTSKFPLLGDVPLLDKFFSYTNKATTKTDLLFFMTVTVLDDNKPLTGHKAL
jgi:type IV pilus assembly protein PilQ